MMANAKQNPQVDLWRGEFGRAYVERNAAEEAVLTQLTQMWSRMLERARPDVGSILEVGANIGLNLRALRRITQADIFAVEPNDAARAKLVADGVVPTERALPGVAAELPLPDASVDLAFTSGVLIHIHPDFLEQSCREIFRVSRRFVLCAEYFAAQPREVPYRNLEGQLFLRDYGRFWLETCPSLRLLDHGFFWTGAGAVDDLTWWLFEKS